MLKELAKQGISAAIGAPLVEKAMNELTYDGPIFVLAVGKAASSMMTGVVCAGTQIAGGILVTKLDHMGNLQPPDHVVVFEAGHPIPNATSLAAGAHVAEWVASLPRNANLVMLLSGGASSLVEVLPDGWSLQDLQMVNQQLLASGADIETINQNRKSLSLIKGGKLLANYNGKRADILYISDVEGDKLSCIGSGLGEPPFRFNFQHSSKILASNSTTRGEIEQFATSFDVPVITNEESLYEDVETLSTRLAQQVSSGPSGLYIFGGESTVKLPSSPGKGGRNQMLALMFARELKRIHAHSISGLFLGTDGTDGPTEYAGATVNSHTLSTEYEADMAIESANPTPFLDQKGACIYLGPTGTNVMDIALIRKE